MYVDFCEPSYKHQLSTRYRGRYRLAPPLPHPLRFPCQLHLWEPPVFTVRQSLFIIANLYRVDPVLAEWCVQHTSGLPQTSTPTYISSCMPQCPYSMRYTGQRSQPSEPRPLHTSSDQWQVNLPYTIFNTGSHHLAVTLPCTPPKVDSSLPLVAPRKSISLIPSPPHLLLCSVGSFCVLLAYYFLRVIFSCHFRTSCPPVRSFSI
jgi:hypothetical protein